jgi:hypothetical protein
MVIRDRQVDLEREKKRSKKQNEPNKFKIFPKKSKSWIFQPTEKLALLCRRRLRRVEREPQLYPQCQDLVEAERLDCFSGKTLATLSAPDSAINGEAQAVFVNN